jgi:hypothetical protein
MRIASAILKLPWIEHSLTRRSAEWSHRHPWSLQRAIRSCRAAWILVQGQLWGWTRLLVIMKNSIWALKPCTPRGQLGRTMSTSIIRFRSTSLAPKLMDPLGQLIFCKGRTIKIAMTSSRWWMTPSIRCWCQATNKTLRRKLRARISSSRPNALSTASIIQQGQVIGRHPVRWRVPTGSLTNHSHLTTSQMAPRDAQKWCGMSLMSSTPNLPQLCEGPNMSYRLLKWSRTAIKIIIKNIISNTSPVMSSWRSQNQLEVVMSSTLVRIWSLREYLMNGKIHARAGWMWGKST